VHSDGKVHGGIALIVRSSIRYYEIGKYQKEFLQTIKIVLEDWYGYIIISTVYSPPKHVLKGEQYIIFFKILDNRFIPAEHYNAKHIH